MATLGYKTHEDYILMNTIYSATRYYPVDKKATKELA
jgi:hypothetical protein